MESLLSIEKLMLEEGGQPFRIFLRERFGAVALPMALLCSVVFHLLVILLLAQCSITVGGHMLGQQIFGAAHYQPSRAFQVDSLSAMEQQAEPHVAPLEHRFGVKYSVSRASLDSAEDFFYSPDQMATLPVPATEIDLEDLESPENPGSFELWVWISSRGRVVQIDTSAKEDLDAAFVERVLQRFLDARFVPGMRDGDRAATVMHIEVTY